MTDLAKLASEITPGKWVFWKNLVNEVECYEIKANDHSVLWRPRYHKTDFANATAMSLVPELIAEALQGRETIGVIIEALEELERGYVTPGWRDSDFKHPEKVEMDRLRYAVSRITQEIKKTRSSETKVTSTLADNRILQDELKTVRELNERLRDEVKMERNRTEALRKDSARKSGIIKELEERLGEMSV